MAGSIERWTRKRFKKIHGRNPTAAEVAEARKQAKARPPASPAARNRAARAQDAVQRADRKAQGEALEADDQHGGPRPPGGGGFQPKPKLCGIDDVAS